MPTSTAIPLLLLKTRTTPVDTYETHFSRSSSPFTPSFIPVLEHQPNEHNLARIKELLRERRLTEEYGGVIFTSQRAVEGFARVVGELDEEEEKVRQGKIVGTESGKTPPTPLQPAAYALTTPFPLYVVGPATSHTLSTLLSHSPLLTSLPCQIHGASTGNGESLARFILKHYNHLHYHAYFSLYEAPRLPFVPLIGNRSEQYPRLESGDQRLRKKGLLFLVGETRRDVIPRVLGEDGLGESERVGVEEVEVYRTGVMGEFEGVFREEVDRLVGEGHERIVVVVFSPSGCEAMLRVIGWRGGGGEEDSATIEERNRGRFVVATIGPTTRGYLRENFGFEADVTARTPSPEGIWEGVLSFLKERGEVAL